MFTFNLRLSMLVLVYVVVCSISFCSGSSNGGESVYSDHHLSYYLTDYLIDSEDPETDKRFIIVYGAYPSIWGDYDDYRNSWTYDDAQIFCENKFNSHLARIDSSDKTRLVYNALDALDSEFDNLGITLQVWFGLTCHKGDHEGTRCRWKDQDSDESRNLKSIDDHNFASGQPNNGLSFGWDDVYMNRVSKKWYDHRFDSKIKTYAFICDYVDSEVNNPKYPSKEETFDIDSQFVTVLTENGNFFLMTNVNDEIDYNFHEANNICKNEFGTTLATADSEAKNEEIINTLYNSDEYDSITAKIIENKVDSAILIGLKVYDGDEESHKYEWSRDGSSKISSLSYNGFYGVQPNEGPRTCVDIDLDKRKWFDHNCDRVKRELFACDAPNLVRVSTDNDNFDIFYEERGLGFTWQAANNICHEMYDSELASVSSNDLNTEIKEKVMDIIDSNNDFDFDSGYTWIGLLISNGDTDNVSGEWADGSELELENDDFVNFANNQPNQGPLSCTSMNGGNGEWYDQTCTTATRQLFACNK